MIKLIPSKSNFRAGVDFAKRLGLRFEPAGKFWMKTNEAQVWDFVDGCKRPDQTRESYLRSNGLEILEVNGERPASSPAPARTAPKPASTYMGQASMDAEDSDF